MPDELLVGPSYDTCHRNGDAFHSRRMGVLSGRFERSMASPQRQQASVTVDPPKAAICCGSHQEAGDLTTFARPSLLRRTDIPGAPRSGVQTR